MQPPQLKVGIIGAGPAGLTAGYILAESGIAVDVFETADSIGGISRTVVYKGFRFDIGGHRFFSKSKEIEHLWNKILPEEMLENERLSRIYYKSKFYSYPLDAGEVIENLGKRESLLSIISYLKAKLQPNPQPENLEDWVTSKFGARLYRTFFKSYTEKVWGRPCTEIAADWAAQRIKGLSLTTAALASLRPTPPTNNGNRSAQIKTLIKTFRYPRLGPGMMWEAAADQIQARGGTIHLNTPIVGFHHDPHHCTWQLEVKGSSKRHGPYQHLISSAPLSAVIRAVHPKLPTNILEAAANLTYRDFVLVALILKNRPTFPDQWLYIHDPDLKVGRIQNFQNWSPAMLDGSGRLCYGMEYFCFENDALWSLPDQDLIAFAAKELIQLQLADSGEVVDGCVVRQAKAYPVYDKHYQHQIDVIRASLASRCPGLHQVGRNGMHRYNNQDHSMMTGILAARAILDPSSPLDPWLVNQDAEYIEASHRAAQD
ncbi:MAG: NAD(P)/FAD-dependent oxidoreductase [Cyanobium sp.]